MARKTKAQIAEEGLDYNEEKQEYERNGDCTTHDEGYEEEVDSEGRVKVWCPEGHEVWVKGVGADRP
jgi:hypothetical protein